jgi:hypothetical protein
MAKEQANPTQPAPDLFSDPSQYRLDQSFLESAGVKKLITTVPVRKPKSQDFIRVHPNPDYREMVAVIELHDDRETYLLTPAIARSLPGEYAMGTLYTCINRQEVVFLWLVKAPTPDGRVLEWHASADTIAKLAMKKWVRVRSNMSLGAYESFEAEGAIPEPTWPEVTFQDLLRIAFGGDRMIDRFDHPVLRRLRGLA